MPPLNGLLRRSCIHGLPVYLSRVARVVSPLNVARVYDDDDDDDDDAKRIRRACCATKLDFFFFFFFSFSSDSMSNARVYIPRSFPAV